MNQENKKIYIIVIIFLVVFSISALIISTFKNNSSKGKIVKDKDYIYKEDIPIINLDDKEASKINELIKKLYEESKNSSMIRVKSNIYDNEKVQSLVIINDNYSIDDEMYLTSYIIYNVDKQNAKIIKQEDLIKKYGCDLNKIEDSARKLLYKYYIAEIDEGYIEQKTDFENYIANRGIKNIIDNTKIYVENEKLRGYMFFSLNSIYNDKDFFSKIDKETIFQFDIN